MIIYWKTLEKDVTDTNTIPEYINSIYFKGTEKAKYPNNDIKCRVYLNSPYIGLSNATPTLLKFDQKLFDISDNFNLSTGKFTVPKTGYYSVSFSILYYNLLAEKRYVVNIKKNADILISTHQLAVVDGYLTCNGSSIEYFEVDDEITLYIENADALTPCNVFGRVDASFLAIDLISI